MDTENQQKSVFRDEETQKELNTPSVDPKGVDEKDQEFLKMVMVMVKDGKIDLLKPNSLINNDVYDGLPEEMKGKADIETMNLLASIRQIVELNQAGFENSYQMQNLVNRVRNTKKRLEEASGDLFII